MKKCKKITIILFSALFFFGFISINDYASGSGITSVRSVVQTDGPLTAPRHRAQATGTATRSGAGIRAHLAVAATGQILTSAPNYTFAPMPTQSVTSNTPWILNTSARLLGSFSSR